MGLTWWAVASRLPVKVALRDAHTIATDGCPQFFSAGQSQRGSEGSLDARCRQTAGEIAALLYLRDLAQLAFLDIP